MHAKSVVTQNWVFISRDQRVITDCLQFKRFGDKALSPKSHYFGPITMTTNNNQSWRRTWAKAAHHIECKKIIDLLAHTARVTQ